MQLPSPPSERAPVPAAGSRGTELIEVKRARPLLGTLVEIRATAQLQASRLHAAIDAAFDRIELVHRLMSYHDPESDLSRLNRCGAGCAHSVDPHTYEVLSAALHFARLSGGAFDPCVAEQLEQWGYLPVASSASAAASWRDIELLSGYRVRLNRPARLDLGGIAKGYAVDLAAEMLQCANVHEIVVNAGGDMRVAGERAHPVNLRHPRALTAIPSAVQLRNNALATSGAYFSRRVSSRRPVSALLDPRTREPYVVNNSVSVRAPTCMTADALTKVVLFAPASIAERVLDECSAEAFVLQGEM
jgi:FAD:protein FMN transferase